MGEVTIVKGKPQSSLRWVILLLNCIMMIGNYYCYDIPAALHTQMKDYFGSPSDFETLFSLLYTVYSIPNIVLPFFGGFFIDKLGVNICLIVFACAIAIGQVVFAIGLSIKSWPIMFLGRIIYGFGGESLSVGQGATLSEWFAGKEVAFAFGLSLSISRLGSVINNLVSPALTNSAGIEFALWFGAILCGISVFCTVCIASINKSFDLYMESHKDGGLLAINDEQDQEGQLIENESSKSAGSTESDEAKDPVKLSDVFSFKQAFWIVTLSCVVVYGCVLPFNNIASSLLLERDYFMSPPSACHLLDPTKCQSDVNVPVDCPSSSWYQPPIPTEATIDNVIYNPLSTSDIDCTSDAWSDGCLKTYCDRQSDAVVEAGTIMSIPYIISACLSPFLGGYVDRYGMRAIIATIAPAALIIVHSLLGFTNVDPVGPLVGQGLAYSAFAAVLWPSIPLVVEAKFIGLGYGLVTSVQNAGLAIFPLIVASIYTSSNEEYIPNAEVFFVILATFGFLVGLYLNYYDYNNDGVFNSPTKSYDKLEDEDENGLVVSIMIDFSP